MCRSLKGGNWEVGFFFWGVRVRFCKRGWIEIGKESVGELLGIG